jgi:hypothetical protein
MVEAIPMQMQRHLDPATMTMAASVASPAAGAVMGAMGTIASGNAQKAAGLMQQSSLNYQADQLTENAAGEVGAAQRRMLDTQQQTRLAVSTLRARGAGGGIDISQGSPVSDAKSIASKGTYHSLMDLWQGENKSTGELNEAAGLRYSGEAAAIGGQEAATASLWSAGGTLASGVGSAATQYGRYAFPSTYGRS